MRSERPRKEKLLLQRASPTCLLRRTWKRSASTPRAPARAAAAAQILSQTQSEGQNLILEETRLLKRGCKRQPSCTSNPGTHQRCTLWTTWLLCFPPALPQPLPPGLGTGLPPVLLGSSSSRRSAGGSGSGSTLQVGVNGSKHTVIPRKSQEPAHLCQYLLLLVKTLDSHISPPVY